MLGLDVPQQSLLEARAAMASKNKPFERIDELTALTTTIVSLTISYRAAQKRGDDLKAARLAHEIDGEIENYKTLLGLD